MIQETSLAARTGIVAIEKVSSVAYLQAVFSTWDDRAVAMPVERAATATLWDHPIARRIAVAPGGGWFQGGFQPDDDPASAQISSTSGTTGEPKRMLLSRRAVSDVTTRLIDVMGMDSEIREYVGIPVTFSFGLGRVRAVAAAGGRSYLPKRGFRVDEVAAMLASGQINALSAVPTLLRVLLQQGDAFSGIGGRLRWLEIGSQFMSGEEKRAIRELFPHARIVQHYGLTEASRTTFLAIDEADDAALESVGKATGKAEVRIDDGGRICIRGPHTASGVLSEAGLMPLADADGWLRTSDLGSLDAAGFLHFRGRVDHVINVAGIKVSPEVFEQRLIERMGGDHARLAVASRPDALRGEAVLVAHLAGVSAARLGEQARIVATELGLGAADVSVVEAPDIPRTETGKIRRDEITALYGNAQVHVAPTAETSGLAEDEPREGRERELAAIWREALGVSAITRHENFFDLGGDSLSAIGVILRMERAGIPNYVTQKIFEGRSIAEIAAEAEGTEVAKRPALRAVTSDAINVTRGLLVLMVILTHWSPFALERMGSLGATLREWTWPIFRIGTPGFAMIFGLGLGYFFMPLVRLNPERLAARLRMSFMVVAAGVVLIGALLAVDGWLSAGGLGPLWATMMFYGVLTFYLLMILTALPVLRLVNAGRYPILATLLLATASLAISELVYPLLQLETTGLIHLVSRLLAANYGYPRMLTYVLLGLAMGLWIEANNDRDDLSRVAIWAGAALFCGGIVLSFATGLQARWFQGLPSPPAIIAYAGAILLIFAFSFNLIRHGTAREWRITRLMVVTGILALPAYVGHGAVMPIKDILVALSMSYALASGLALLAFVVPFGIAMRRIYRMYYG